MLPQLASGHIIKHRYVVDKKLGGGKNAITYSVSDYDDKKMKAMKIFRTDRVGSFCWRTEVNALTKLRGISGIPTLYDWFDNSTNRYLVIGEQLLDLQQLKKNNQLEEVGLKNVLTIAFHSLTLLQMIHSQNLILRNICLSQIMLRKDHGEHTNPIAIVNFSCALDVNLQVEGTQKDPMFVRSKFCTPSMFSGNISTKKDDLLLWVYAMVELIDGDVFGVAKNENPVTIMSKKKDFELEPFKYTDEQWIHAIVKKLNNTKVGLDEKYNTIRSIICRHKRGFDPKTYTLETGFNLDNLPYLL